MEKILYGDSTKIRFNFFFILEFCHLITLLATLINKIIISNQ